LTFMGLLQVRGFPAYDPSSSTTVTGATAYVKALGFLRIKRASLMNFAEYA